MTLRLAPMTLRLAPMPGTGMWLWRSDMITAAAAGIEPALFANLAEGLQGVDDAHRVLDALVTHDTTGAVVVSNETILLCGLVEVAVFPNIDTSDTPDGRLFVGTNGVRSIPIDDSVLIRVQPTTKAPAFGDVMAGSLVAAGAVIDVTSADGAPPRLRSVRKVDLHHHEPGPDDATEMQPTVVPNSEQTAALLQAAHTAPPEDSQRHVDAEAVMVRGLRCRNNHHNAPDALLCAFCGDNMQNQSIALATNGQLGVLGPRPALGILTFDDGSSHQVIRDLIVGRSPSASDPGTEVLTFGDDELMSRQHFAVELNEWSVSIRDLGSSNGTQVQFDSDASFERLHPNIAYPLPNGAVIVAGRRWATFVATLAHTAPRTPAS